jgi:Domain of unknown function (DUF5615)
LGENPEGEGGGHPERTALLSIRFQADNDLRSGIVRAAQQREPSIDFASAQEAGLDRVSDPEVLDRAALEGRVLVSHDRRTMIDHFRRRISSGKHSPGLLIVSQDALIGEVVDAMLYLWAFSEPLDLRDQVYYLPSLSRHVFSR